MTDRKHNQDQSSPGYPPRQPEVATTGSDSGKAQKPGSQSVDQDGVGGANTRAQKTAADRGLSSAQ